MNILIYALIFSGVINFLLCGAVAILLWIMLPRDTLAKEEEDEFCDSCGAVLVNEKVCPLCGE